jgi:hemoglobin/transferrin/lactoferrin receptor protein
MVEPGDSMSQTICRSSRGVRREWRTSAVLSLLFATLLGVHPAAAADSKSATKPALADTSKPVMFLKETVVTGARFPRRYYESPQALSFISSQSLMEQSPIVIGDALAKLPGVDNSKDSPWEQRPVLRGLGGQRALVLVDGIPMNSARGNGPHPSLVDPSQIDRVEVVRGPSSVAYGSDALGGAINIITREANPNAGSQGMTLNGAVSLTGSSGDNQYGGSVELRPTIGKLGMLVSAGAHHADDFTAPDGDVPHSSFKDWQSMVSARYALDTRTALTAAYQMYRGSDIGIPGLSSPVAAYPPGWTDVFSFPYYDRDLVQAGVERKYEKSWIASSRVQLYYQGERRNFFDAQSIDSSLYGYLGLPPDGSTSANSNNNRYFDLKTWGLQLQALSRQTKTYRFTMGLDAARDQTSGNNVTESYEVFSSGPTPSTFTTSQAVPNGHFDNYGLYFENEWYMHPQWTMSVGARWNQYDYKTESGVSIPADYFGPGSPAVLFDAKSVTNGAPSGSIGLVYSPVQDLHLSANVANGYRQPNAQDLFYNGFASVGLVIGDPDLKPEKSISYDLGLRYEHKAAAVSGNLFYSTYDDLIDAVLYQSNPYYQTFKYTNISKARIWGGEAEGEWAFMRNYKARATAAGAIGDITSRESIETLYGVDADQVPLGGVPPFKGSFGIRWDATDRRFWAEPSMRYSWRTNRLPPPTGNVEQLVTFKKEWLVVDVMAGARLRERDQLTVGVRNIGDLRYTEALASLPSPGRAFVASLTTNF